MAVLKFLVSAALLGTVARSQNSPAYPQNSPAYYQAYSPGGSLVQYSPSIFNRGTARLVPIKVRAAPSRIIPSFYYPQVPPPNLAPNYQRQTRQLLPAYATNMLHQPNFQLPRLQQYRSAMTGYYRPARQSYFSNPFYKQENQHGVQQQYHTAATSAPAVVKRGRVLSASPYSLESAAASSTGGGFQYAPHGIPAVSTYRPAPQQYQQQQQQQQQQQYQPQIAAAPIHHARPQPQYASSYQQPQQHYQPQQQQPTYYIQKSPLVVGGPDRPRKLIKVKKVQLAQPVREAAEPEEEEYPGDPNPQYNFSFDIKDDELTNYQNRQEERDGQTIKGSYSVVDPDGYVRTVTYTADPKNGFQAKVTREPTDVKIKFPVPTLAPAQSQQPIHKSSAQNGRRGQHTSYITPQQYQQQPQYQTAAYATPREVYANTPSATSTVQVLSAPLPSLPSTPFISRSSRRVYAVQPEAAASAPQPRVVSVSRGSKSVRESKKEQQQQSDTESE